MIIAGGGVMELIGILIGHLYFFLTFKYPQDFGGPSLIATPEFLYRWFPNSRGGVRGFGIAPAQAQAPGINFTNVLHAAFTLIGPKSA